MVTLLICMLIIYCMWKKFKYFFSNFVCYKFIYELSFGYITIINQLKNILSSFLSVRSF